MGLTPFTPKPGIIKSGSEYANEGRWIDGDHVRFKMKLPEKIGGWDEMLGGSFVGMGRGLRGWRGNDGAPYVAIGTEKKLYVWSGGMYEDVTPLRESGTLGADPITTASGSAIVTIADAAHGLGVGDYATLGGATAVGGITVAGEYVVLTVPTSGTYTITHSVVASSTATGGGALVTYAYQITIGYADNIPGYGYGVGAYGEDAYGTARATSITLGARIWHLDIFGEDLLALHRDGNLYRWDTSAGGRAAIVAGAPTNNKAMFVSSDVKVHLLGADGDPRRDEWCETADITIWTPASDNDAGGKSLQGGSGLMAGARGEGFNLVWTDVDLFVLIAVPTDLIYDERRIGSYAGLMAPRAFTEIDGTYYWMGPHRFHQFQQGVLSDIPNQAEILGFVYGDQTYAGFNRSQTIKFHVGANVAKREIWFFYCSAASIEIDRYVIYDLVDKCWSPGTMARTAFEQTSAEDMPLALGTDSVMYVHETGVDADDAALAYRIKSAPVEVGDGDKMMDVLGVVLDFARHEGNITMTVYAREYPNAEELVEDEITLEPGATREGLRAQGRQVAVEFSADAIGSDFRLGKLRLDVQPAGARK